MGHLGTELDLGTNDELDVRNEVCQLVVLWVPEARQTFKVLLLIVNFCIRGMHVRPVGRHVPSRLPVALQSNHSFESNLKVSVSVSSSPLLGVLLY